MAQLDALLASEPDDLPAQFSRAVLLLGNDRAGAKRALTALLAHPRFRELLAKEPESIRAFDYLSLLHLQGGNLPEGLALARRGLFEAERLRALQGPSHYRLASAYALAAKADPTLVTRAAEHLKRASAIHRGFQDREFPRDPLFDDVRPLMDGLLTAP